MSNHSFLLSQTSSFLVSTDIWVRCGRWLTLGPQDIEYKHEVVFRSSCSDDPGIEVLVDAPVLLLQCVDGHQCSSKVVQICGLRAIYPGCSLHPYCISHRSEFPCESRLFCWPRLQRISSCTALAEFSHSCFWLLYFWSI